MLQSWHHHTCVTPVQEVKPSWVGADDRAELTEIKQFLLRILQKQGTSRFHYFPSMDALTGFFTGDEEDVYRILDYFTELGYRYKVSSPKAPIIIWDALGMCS